MFLTQKPQFSTEQILRAEIIRVAATWLKTPFVDCQGLKHHGVDCAYLLARVAEEAGVIKHVDMPKYSPQIYLHRKADGTWDNTYETTILQYAREITLVEVKPGDFVVYKQAHSYTHGGIIISWPDKIIHPIQPHGVIYSSANEGFLKNRKHRFFSFFPENK